MRTLFFLTTILSTLGVSSCALTPSSPDGMRMNGTLVKTVCSQGNPQEVAKRIAEGWRRCYFIGPTTGGQQAVMVGNIPILVPTKGGSGDYIDLITNGNRITVAKGNMQANNVQIMADIEATPSCPAQITLRGGNAAWSGKAATGEILAEKPETPCKNL